MFDQVVVVDWSASARPTTGRDSIWIATCDLRGIVLENPATRTLAATLIEQRVTDAAGAATLLAVDFSLGYPAGTAHALGLDGVPSRAMWDLLTERIVDGDDNENNRFALASQLNGTITGGPAPFWGCPASQRTALLRSTKPAEPGPLPAWRLTEEVLRSSGHHPFSSWQLLGAGAVGSQSLMGIPMLHRLVERLAPGAFVWPFDTGLTTPPTTADSATVAEVWPSMFSTECAPRAAGASDVRDARQVGALARKLFDASADGTLTRWFAPSVPADAVSAVVEEEGWILGVS